MTAYRYTEHTNDIGDSCPYSGELVQPEPTENEEDVACPQNCRDSGIERTG